jgi:hypothetical protein
MKKVYRDILKELNKGNLVLVDVRQKLWVDGDRFRMLWGKKCVYDFIDSGNDSTGFVRSCFTLIENDHPNRHFYRAPKTTNELVLEMEKYDEDCELTIKDFMVLK